MKTFVLLLLLITGLFSDEKLSDLPLQTQPPLISKTSARNFSQSVNTNNRSEVLKFYKSNYRQPMSVKNGWTGNTKSCIAGTNSKEYTDATLKTLNFFRAMLGVPADITFKQEFNDKALKSALIMDANFNLSHNPPTSWKCYSEEGKQGAANSNIAVGTSGPSAISLYMWDPGSGNYFVGHRRWIMSPSEYIMGSGSTDKGDSLWVFGEFRKEKNTKEYVSWPNSGFTLPEFGYRNNYRWSFTAHYAQVKDANIVIKKDGKSMQVNKEKYAGGYGEGDTIVWTLPELSSKKIEKDETFYVEIQGIKKEGQSLTHKYTVTFINPDIESANETDNKETQTEIKQLTEEEKREFIQAVYKGDNSIVTAFLEKGADPNIKHEGWTSLMLASYYGHLQIVKTLLKFKADKEINVSGYKPVDLAIAMKHKEVVDLLGLPANSRMHRSKLPLPPKN